jgi:D-3-phosphoglycerate dehydrogenase / 2-oxoglutarate reductase
VSSGPGSHGFRSSGGAEAAPRAAAIGPQRTILVSESGDFSPAAAARLRQEGSLVLADLDRAGLVEAVAPADVLWVRLRHRIDKPVFAAAARLRILVTATTGLDHVDLEEARERGVRVLSLRGETEFLRNVRATAEHTVGLILALLRHTPAAVSHVRSGEWNRDSFRGRELYGKTAGVVGYGRLGRIVARYLQAFGMEVLAVDPHVEAASADSGVRLVSLPQLLRAADVVTLHVNLCEETRRLLGAAELAALKRGAWLINTSRGEVLDEAALLDALRSGHLAGAALDVLSGESSNGMGSHPLVEYARSHDNLLVTPHIGGCTAESTEATETFLAGRLCELFRTMDDAWRRA